MTRPDLVVPTARDAVVALNSPTLYALEQAGEIAREVLDARIVGWTKQRWSQNQIADEIGCSRQAVSKRQARLEVKSQNEWHETSGGGGNWVAPPEDTADANPGSTNGANPVTDIPDEITDAEVVEELDFVCEQEWSEEERNLRAELEDGQTILVNFGRHRDLVRWAEAEGLLVRIDRKTDWGNPFKLDADGDRDTVIASYRAHYLPHKPSLQGRLGELRGKALGCWCAPEACHGDILLEALQ